MLGSKNVGVPRGRVRAEFRSTLLRRFVGSGSTRSELIAPETPRPGGGASATLCYRHGGALGFPLNTRQVNIKFVLGSVLDGGNRLGASAWFITATTSARKQASPPSGQCRSGTFGTEGATGSCSMPWTATARAAADPCPP